VLFVLPSETPFVNLTSGIRAEIVRNQSVSLSLTFTRNEKVEHYIRIKIALRFWVESGVNALRGWAQVSLEILNVRRINGDFILIL